MNFLQKKDLSQTPTAENTPKNRDRFYDNYDEEVLNYIQNSYQQDCDYHKLTRPNITRALCDRLNQEKGWISSENEILNRHLQPSVYRAIERLKKKNKILCINKKYYVPYNIETLRLHKHQELTKLPFQQDGIFFVSLSTILLAIERTPTRVEIGVLNEIEAGDSITVQAGDSIEVNDNAPIIIQDDTLIEISENDCIKIHFTNAPSYIEEPRIKYNNESLTLDEVAQLFKDFLTEKNCFAIHTTEHYFVLLIKGTAAEKKALAKELKAIYAESRKWQDEIEKKKKIKIKRKNTPPTTSENATAQN